MRNILWVVLVLDQLFLLIVGSADLNKYELSEFQVKEKYEGLNDKKSKLLKKLHRNLAYVKRQQQLELTIAFAVGVTLWTYLIENEVVGLTWAMFLALLIMIIRRSSWIKRYSYQLFEKSLELILNVALRMKPLWWLIGLPRSGGKFVTQSRQELADTLSNAHGLEQTEKERLLNVLEISSKTAKEILTPARKVNHISPGATLGPVLLADLQRSGHGYFPVMSKKEGIVGMLNLKLLGDIASAKQHAKVGEIMSEELVWVPDDMPVLEVAKMFLEAKQYVLLVQNEQLEFAGIITIADLLKHTLSID